MKSSLRIVPVAVGLVVALLIFFGSSLVEVWVDWLWFGEVGQRQVYWGLLGSRWALGLGFGLALTALTYANLAIARRATPRYIPRPGAREWQQAAGTIAREGLAAAILFGSLVLGWFSGLVASGQWDAWLRFRNSQSFGTADPVFHRDLGFYVFQYPFLQFLASWVFGTLVVVTLATAAVYYLDGAILFLQQRARIAGQVHVHLSVLLGLTMLAKAWDYWLDRFELLLQPGGVVHGAGYTDLHARLPALNILVVVALAAAVGFFLNTRVRAMWLPGLALAVMAVASLTVRGLYPTMVQRFVVAPDEPRRERPYIQRHLEATRAAYGLDAIQPRDFNPGRPLAPADLAAERGTLQNIRLWDYRLLSQTYQRLQGLRNYYDVSDVDIDRYVVDGTYRQVMLAPRELVTDNLDPQNRRWVNERLQFTHGYGLVMSAVHEADPAGRPLWLASNLPLEMRPGIRITRPQLYYGMQDQAAVVAPSGAPELDYPAQGENVTSIYAGSGGIPLGSLWSRMLFSGYLGDGNLLISDQIRPNSRLLIRRRVVDRVARVAPFLHLDQDPYLVILDGRLVWVLDAYTTSASYPYSEPTLFEGSGMLEAGGGGARPAGRGHFNYLRNPVKATVDAYTGEVALFVLDPRDPVLACYRRAFPALFRDGAALPEELRAHLRYPADLFSIQAHKLLRFHVSSPEVFYQRSDVWEVPTERMQEADGGRAHQMEPYYVVMRLPGSDRDEFTLILPFRTRAGTTMAAWLAGGCDGPSYGKLRLYSFPTTSQVDSPEQVDQAIITDRDVSKETTLLGQVGATVRYGNLLVLPVGNSLLYVKPLYLEGTQQGRAGGIPELKQVILAEKRGNELKVVMRPTLSDALETLVGGPVSTTAREAPSRAPTAPSGGPVAPVGLNALVDQAQAAFDAAERAQRAGDWAEYGKQMEQARAAIRRLGQTVGGAR